MKRLGRNWRKMQDIFGLALYSYWKGNHKTKYKIINDVSHIESDSLQRYFITYNKFPLIEKKALKHAKGKILDVGCGAGRHIIYFQNKKFDIIGVDSSKLAVKVCKERGCRNVIVSNILNLKLKNKSFDTILLFGNNIGIGGNLNGIKKLLKKLRSLAKKDGLLLLSSFDVKATKDKKYFSYHKRNLELGRHIGQLKLRLGYKNKFSDWFNWIHIEPHTLKKIASECKWKSERTYKGKNGRYAMVLRAV